MINKIKNFYESIFKVFLSDRASLNFSVGIIVGMAFSIAVILCTVGIMDGFVLALKTGLKKANGDVIAYSDEGFFEYDKELKPEIDAAINLSRHKIATSTYVQTEGFIVGDKFSKGIVLKGVDPATFNQVTGLNIQLEKDQIVLGTILAEELKVKAGESVVIALADGNRELSGMPALNSFEFKESVDHQIYEKNMRFAYVHKEYLQNLLELPKLDNTLLLNFKDKFPSESERLDAIDDLIIILMDKLGPTYTIKSYSQEYTPLIEAVKVEKFMIGLILQLIVVIAMFNVLAFIIYINEKKVQEVFLLQALGLSPKKLLKYMVQLTCGLWFFACVLSIGFVGFFDFLLQTLPIFQLPGEVYSIGRIKIELGFTEYLTVFISSGFWLALINFFGVARFRKKSILSGLRSEFA